MNAAANSSNASSDSGRHRVKHAQFKWIIDNFSTFPETVNRYSHSPTFSLRDTEWNLGLHPRDKKYGVQRIAVYVARSNHDSAPETVMASFRLGLESGDNKVWFQPEERKEFRKGNAYGSQTSVLGHLADFLSEGGEDNLVVLCEIYVWYLAGTTETLEWNGGGNLLDFNSWRDLLGMKDYTDILLVGEMRAHKCVLSARSRTLSKFLEDGKSVWRPNCSRSCLATALLFMYSGSHGFLVKNCVFSIGLYELACELSLSKLKELLTPRKLEHKSTVANEEGRGWGVVKEFRLAEILRQTEIRTCVFKNLDIGMEIQVSFQRSLEYKTRGKNIDCHLTIVGLLDALQFRYDVFLLNSNVTPCQTVKPKSCTNVGFFDDKSFRCILTYPISEVLACVKPNLSLMFHFNCRRSAIRHLTNVHRYDDGELPSYDTLWKNDLSSDFETLFSTGEHSDFTLRAQEEIFRVHRCLLAARSETFRHAIDSKGGSMEISNVNFRILALMLQYIYGGRLVNPGRYSKATILLLYDAAKKFKIESLAKECQKHMNSSCMDPEFVYDILKLAQKHNDSSLMMDCIIYIQRLTGS